MGIWGAVHKLSLGMLVVAMLVVVVGCGSDGASTANSTTSSGPLSPAQFAATATELCDAARRAYLTKAPEALLRMQVGGNETRQELESKVVQKVMAPSLQGKVEGVRALGIPKGDEKQVEEILTSIEEVATKARTEPEKFLFQQTHFKHPFQRARRLATAYGI